MVNIPPLSLYVHIPWCVQKCPYCDFNSHKLKGEIPHRDYISHLLRDLQQDLTLFPELTDREIHSIFIGGGTPSLLEGDAIAELISGIAQQIPIKEGAEISMEANPGTAESERFIAYQRAGINRISLGIQSFQDDKLTTLGRIHNSTEAINAVKMVPKGIRSVNLDLMHGLPQQRIEDALYDLQQAISLNPTHLSWYQLTIEPNTLFASRPPRLPDDEQLWEIYEKGDQLLRAAGYQQYETSAYAKEGYQCQHNLNYWRFGDYIGIGCGAHGKLTRSNGDIYRTVKKRHPSGYMEGEYIDRQTQVSDNELPFEFFMNRFRLFEATPRADFSNFTGLNESLIRPQIEKAILEGYLLESSTTWQLTKKGKLFLNSLLEMFIDD